MKRIHFIGVGGSGMKPLAILAALSGYRVSGSDLSVHAGVKREMEESGIVIYTSHDPSYVLDVDTVVYSTAIQKDHPELAGALELEREGRAEVIHRMEMLNRLVRGCEIRIGIAGTHGKTSSSSMAGWLLENLGYDPHIIVGGRPAYLPNGVKRGKGDVAVFETDESDGSFLKSNANLRLILNVDSDHIEYYGSEDALRKAFGEYAESGDLRVVNGNDPFLLSLYHKYDQKEGDFLTFGTSDYPFPGLRFEPDSDGLWLDEKNRIKLQIPGRHFASNALGVLTLIHLAIEKGILGRPGGYSLERAVEILNAFPGVERRVEYLGKHRGASVYDDYGHHPTEIREVISALRMRQPEGGRLIAVFQPHRYSRVFRHYREFARELDKADRVFLLPVYSAGEEPIDGISANSIANEFPSRSRCTMVPDGNLDHVFQSANENDVVVCFGAGDISRKIRDFLSRIN